MRSIENADVLFLNFKSTFRMALQLTKHTFNPKNAQSSWTGLGVTPQQDPN